MNIGEFATALVLRHSREHTLAEADSVLRRVLGSNADELVPGRDVARLLATAMYDGLVNGSRPRVVTRVMDDGLQLKDGIG